MNPFVQNFKLKVVKVNTTYYETKTHDITEGVVGKFKQVTESFLAEQQEKTSVYDVGYIENILFKELKSNGRDMLLYVIYNLEKDSDIINLKQDKVCEKIGISRATYYSAIQQLIDVAILCRKHSSEYWINPFYLFKGNRIEYYNKIDKSAIEIVAEIKR